MIYLTPPLPRCKNRPPWPVPAPMRQPHATPTGGHQPAMLAAETAFACRQAAAELFHVGEPDNVVLTFNATHGLNIAIQSLSTGDTG